MTLGKFLFSLAAFAGVVIATQGCALLQGTDTTSEDPLCTPGTYVFCRCADRTPGTKLCKDDAKSFEPCTTGAGGECVGGEVPDSEKFCVPGAYVFCRCADRSPGTKLCKDDAKSFEACTTDDGNECIGGEIDDPRTNEPIPPEKDPDPSNNPPDKPNAIESCPGRSTAVQPGVPMTLEGDTTSATADREGRQGACAVGAGANDHVYRLIPSGTGSLEVKVQGSDGLDPVVYVRTTCDDQESQTSCGPPSPQKLAQLKLNVVTGRQYYLFIDGASSSAGKYVATLTLTPGSFCGDGKVDQGEACDDGNKVEDDGCANSCRQVNGNPTTGGSCPGHPVHVWPGQTVTGVGSTASYGNTFAAPSQACDTAGTNNYSDHVYEVTPHGTGNLVVTLSAASGKTLPNLMLSARSTCTSATPASANMCANDGGAGAGETMTFAVTNNKKVYVAVDGGGVSNNKGDYSISFKLQ